MRAFKKRSEARGRACRQVAQDVTDGERLALLARFVPFVRDYGYNIRDCSFCVMHDLIIMGVV